MQLRYIMIIKEKYLKASRCFQDSNLVKVTTDVRRCGKFVILETIINYLKERNANIIQFNFKKIINLDKAINTNALVYYFDDSRKNKNIICFFDEM